MGRKWAAEKVGLRERCAFYSIYLVIAEFLLFCLIFLISVTGTGWIDQNNADLFRILVVNTGRVALFFAAVIFPIAAFFCSWIGMYSSNRNQANAGMVLAIVGLIPLVLFLVAWSFLRGMG